MQQASSTRSWTEIVAFRRRDRLVILPMTLMAALAGSFWLDWRFCVAWFGVNVAFMAVSKVFCDWIGSRRNPGAGLEWALAAFTFAMTAAYCALPVAMVSGGTTTGAVAGAAMVGAVALSSVSEFVISRRIGGAAIAALFVAGVAGAVLQADPTAWGRTVLALASMSAFFFYVVQAAHERETTEQRMREVIASARRAEAAAEAANAAKSAFLATISHEIRTPLNGVLGMAQAMEADALSQTQRERLGVIRQSGATLTALLSDVLDLSKIEAGQLQLETIAFDLEELLQASCSAFAALAASKTLDLTLEVADAAAGTYEGDPTRVRQVLQNLISNAIKFTDRGGVTVRAGLEDGHLALSVGDSGVGIAGDKLDQLFDKFVQLDVSTTRRHGGTGLGLSICRDLCTLMGGTIWVESRLGHGSVFTAKLPLARVSDPGAEAPRAARGDLAPQANLRVLAAEDNAVNQLVLRTLMKQAGIEPLTVENGAEALAAWEGGEWHVILMDVQMPVMDGLTAVREIRAREAETGRRRTPVIALTANAMVHQIAELRDAGMDAHVGKPIDVAQLFAAIEEVLDAAADEPTDSGSRPAAAAG